MGSITMGASFVFNLTNNTMKKFNLLSVLFVILTITVTSCSVYTCPTYSGAKPNGVKSGTYNPRKPQGLQVRNTVVAFDRR